MRSQSRTSADEVDQLIRNACLRDAMEPYRDEAFDLVNSARMTTATENDYLQSMLDWEQAPALPIARWFNPELVLPHPSTLDDDRLRDLLWNAIHRLNEQKIVLAYTDHLSDRELYCVLYRDILPALEKKLERRSGYSYWLCLDPDRDVETWIRYYASETQRERWADESGLLMPSAETAPYPRVLPGPPPPA